MSNSRSLKSYRSKRNFSRSREPSGKKKEQNKQPVFVIQQHDASNMHFDFRLEIEGVLVSWAVPKGPSTDSREKRLAVMTEDHPLAYADFEGVIPQDEYGGGTVLIWDRGTYRNITEGEDEPKPLPDALEEGHLAVWLEGSKIQGGYALTRVKYRGEDNWLLVKMKDDKADARRKPVNTQPKSVQSGRTLQEIAAEEDEKNS